MPLSRRRAVLLWACLAAGSAPPRASADEGREAVRAAQDALKGDDASRFPEVEKRLSALEPKSFDVWLALGELLRAQEKSVEADRVLEKALTLKPGDAGAERELALVDQDLGRDEEAARLFEALIAQGERDYDLYLHLARSDMRLGRAARAKEAFARAKKLKAASLDAYIDEGYFHIDVGEPALAEEAFQNAIAADTGSPVGYHHMGAYLSHAGRYREAEAYFRRALDRLDGDPRSKTDDFLHTLNALGDAIRLQGRPAEAETVYRRCLDKPAPSGLYVNCLRSLGKLYSEQDKNAQAEEIFARAEAACKDGAPCSCRGRALIDLGNFYLKLGRKREAADKADRAGRLCANYHASNLSLLMDLGELSLTLGDASKAEALFGRVVAAGRSMPFNPVLAGSLARMAELEMGQGRFHRAEDDYRLAITTSENRRDRPQEAAALDGLAAACESQGKRQEAARAREKAKALRDSEPARSSAE